jgi:hypothetical protein
VIAGNQVAESEESFTVRNPVITDFSPKSGTFNDVITIYGENFIHKTFNVRNKGIATTALSITSSVIQAWYPTI